MSAFETPIAIVAGFVHPGLQQLHEDYTQWGDCDGREKGRQVRQGHAVLWLARAGYRESQNDELIDPATTKCGPQECRRSKREAEEDWGSPIG